VVLSTCLIFYNKLLFDIKHKQYLNVRFKVLIKYKCEGAVKTENNSTVALSWLMAKEPHTFLIVSGAPTQGGNESETFFLEHSSTVICSLYGVVIQYNL
jgi:hypothetical protein